jgi:predicted fused transcriptional regulator/phosphomethylpyrimidine kinase
MAKAEDHTTSKNVKFTTETVKAANRTGTALLLIDFQNEFTAPGGKLNQDVKEVMESTGMLSKIPRVVSNAR